MKYLFYFLMFLSTLSQAISTNTCGVGCNDCDVVNTVCNSCQQGFSLDTITNSYCVYQECQQGLLMQYDSFGVPTCTAVCSQNNYQNRDQNICSPLYQCSMSYQTLQSINRGDYVKGISPLDTVEGSFILVQFPNYINLVKRQNGEYIQTVNYTPDIQQLINIPNNIIILTSNSTVFSWDLIKNTRTLITQIQYQETGISSSATTLIKMHNSIICSLFNYSSNQIVLFNMIILTGDSGNVITPVDQIFNTTITYSNKDSINFYNTFVCLHNQTKLEIYEIILNDDSSNYLSLQSYNVVNKCQSIPTSSILDAQKAQSSVILLFNQNPAILSVDSSSCNKTVVFAQNPLKMIQFSNSTQNYFLIQFSNSISIYGDASFSVLLTSLSFPNLAITNIVSRKLKNQQNYLLSLFILTNDDSLSFYEIQMNNNSSIILVNLNTTLDILIHKPSNIYIINNSTNAATNEFYYDRLFVTYQDVQSITLLEEISTSPNNQLTNNLIEKTEYTINNFQSYQKSHNRISTLLILYNQRILASCGADGSISVWDISNPFREFLMYQVFLSTDSCQDLQPFQSNSVFSIIAVFQRNIYVVDLVTSQISKQWNYSGQKMKYSVKNNSTAILVNTTLTVFSNTLASLQTFSYPGVTSDLSKISIESNNILVSQRQSTIEVYSYSANPNTFKKIYTYTSTAKIQLFKIRNFSNSYQQSNNINFEIILFQADQKLILLKDSLIVERTISNIPLSSVVDVQFYNNDSTDGHYFIQGKTNKTISTEPYEMYVINKSSSNFFFLYALTQSSQFLAPQRYTDSYQNPIYDLKTLSQLSSMSQLTSYSYDPTRNLFFLEQIQLNMGQVGLKLSATTDTSYLIGTSSSGQVSIGNYKIVQYKSIYAQTSTELSQGIFIQSVQYSYFLNCVFVIKQNIIVYNIHTFSLVEQLNFPPSTSSSALNYLNAPIEQFIIIESQYVIVALKQNVILVKNYQSNQIYYYDGNALGLTISTLKEIITSQEQFILVVGSNVLKLNFTLQSYDSSSLTLSSNQIVTQIKVSPSLKCLVLVLQLSDFGIIIANKISLQVMALFYSKTLFSDFQIHIDYISNSIQLFKDNYIEVYSLRNGIYQFSWSPTEDIIQSILAYANYTIILSQTSVVVLDRKSLSTLSTVKLPGGGNIIKVLYIKEYNHIAISGDSINSGQIFIYSLTSQTIVQIFMNQYLNNIPSIVVDFYYDSYMNIFTYIDQTGNIISIDYEGAYQYINLMKIKEYQLNGTFPSGMLINIDNNSMYVFDRVNIFNINYAGFSDKMKQYTLNTRYSSFIEITSSNTDKFINTQQNAFIILGSQNILYQYSQYSYSFFTSIDASETILDIRLLSQNTLLLILKSGYMIMNCNISINNTNDPLLNQTSVSFSGVSFGYFLCNNIFYSLTHEIIQFDFVNQNITNRIPLAANEVITTSRLINTTLVIGMNDGVVLFYDISHKNLVSYSLNQQNLLINDVKFIVTTTSSIWVSTAGQYALQVSKANLSIVNYYNLSDVSSSFLLVTAFQVDDINQRIFVGYQKNKRVKVIQISSNQIFTYLSFPNSSLNQILILTNQIVIYSSFQINIFDRSTLQFIMPIRRQNLFATISSIQVFLNQYYFILYLEKFEIMNINLSTKTSILMDQVPVNQFTLIQIRLESNNNFLRVIGMSSNQIFDQKYSLNLGQYQGLTQFSPCGVNFNGMNYIQMTQQFQRVQPYFQPLPALTGLTSITNSSSYYQLNIFIDESDFSEINFNVISNSSSVIYAYSAYTQASPIQGNQNFSLSASSFSQFPEEDLFMQYFNFVIQNIDGQPMKVQFSQQIDDIIFQNVNITNQQILQTQVSFENMDSVILMDLYLSDLSLNQTNSDFSFFWFLNCSYVLIQNLFITNVTFNGGINNFLLSFENIGQITLQNVVIRNSVFSSLSSAINIDNILIDGMEVYNCSQFNSGNNAFQDVFLLNIKAAENQNFTNIQMHQNTNLLFMISNSTYELPAYTLIVESVKFSLFNSLFESNKINYGIQSSLICVSSTFINITNIKFNDNTANFEIDDSQIISISQSSFSFNENMDGGALEINKNQQQIQISQSDFFQNKALASGGAIIFRDIEGSVSICNQTRIQQNFALVGGGIRFYNNAQCQKMIKLAKEIKTLNITNNVARIYGQDVTSYLNKVKVVQINQTPNGSLLSLNFTYFTHKNLSSQEKSLYSSKITLENINSGQVLSMLFKLQDQFGDILKYDTDLFNSKKYPQSIQSEIQNFTFKLMSQDTDQVILVGNTQVHSDSYNPHDNTFNFQNFQLISLPFSSANVFFQFSINSQSSNPIIIQSAFRNCKVGEILQQYGTNIYSCLECPKGFYQLQDFSQLADPKTNKISNQLTSMKCLICPEQADYCQGSTLHLLEGYWRANKSNSQILYCTNQPTNCVMDDTSINGCTEGMIGPLCEECDAMGDVWSGKRYTKSYTTRYSCNECNKQYVPFILLITLMLGIIFYSLLNTFMFMNNFAHTQTCYYLRILHFIPLSKSCIRDQSSFYLKILMNYLQLTSYIIDPYKVFPKHTNTPIVFLQTPSFYFISIQDCLTNSFTSSRISRIHVLHILQAIFPFVSFFFVAGILKILQRVKVLNAKRSYLQTLINFMIIFFQPGQITFFTQSLSCRTINQQKYTELDLLIQCNDKQYMQFSLPFSVSILCLWIISPLFILNKLQNHKKKLNYCLTKFKFGYFYSEFHEKYYYWEFIRMYMRITIIMLFTLVNNNTLQDLLVVFLLITYLKILIQRRPVLNNILQWFDILSYIMIALSIILTQINQEYSSNLGIVAIYTLHIFFIIIILYMILSEKFKTKFKLISQFFKKIIQKVLPNTISKEFRDSNLNVNFLTLQKWKRIKQNLSYLILKQHNTLTTFSLLQKDHNKPISGKRFSSLNDQTIFTMLQQQIGSQFIAQKLMHRKSSICSILDMQRIQKEIEQRKSIKRQLSKIDETQNTLDDIDEHCGNSSQMSPQVSSIQRLDVFRFRLSDTHNISEFVNSRSNQSPEPQSFCQKMKETIPSIKL